LRISPPKGKPTINRGTYGEVVHYEIHDHTPTVFEWKNQNLRLTIEHDNLANHFEELNGTLLSESNRHILEELNRCAQSPTKIETVRDEFFRPSLNPEWNSSKSLLHLLETSNNNQWKTVGDVPIFVKTLRGFRFVSSIDGECLSLSQFPIAACHVSREA
jgi:hypothetical protein